MKLYCQCFKASKNKVRTLWGDMSDGLTPFDRKPNGYMVCEKCQEEVHPKTVARIRQMEDDGYTGKNWGVIPGFNVAGGRETLLDRPTYKGKLVEWVR